LLRDGIPGQKGFQSGMTKTFGLLNPRFEFVAVDTSSSGTSADRYRRAISDALAQGDLPDAALVIVTDQDGDLPDPANPYLHSKAMLLMAGVPTQEARLSTVTRRQHELQYVLQNVAVALYAKMKGVPWTVDQDLTIADELVIGIGTAELSESRTAERQRYVGITTVFRGDGNYLLGQLSREASYADYPTVLRDSTRDVIEEIKKRNGWQPDDTVRLIFHAARPPRNVDFARLMSDAVRAVGRKQHVECAFLTVSHDHPFTLFDTSQPGKETAKGRKGQLAPDRGLIVQTGRYSRLVNTSGVTLVKRAGLPLPRPLQVHLRRGSTFTDLHYLSEQVLKFTGLSWRSTQPAADPVTIYYSELIARLLGRLKAVPDWSPALLDARLRTSKWFI
jgi:argonaute-like protein implicated in RNA metabolism and viral defense